MQDALRLLFVYRKHHRSPMARCTTAAGVERGRIIGTIRRCLGIIDKPADPLAVKVMGEISIDWGTARAASPTR